MNNPRHQKQRTSKEATARHAKLPMNRFNKPSIFTSIWSWTLTILHSLLVQSWIAKKFRILCRHVFFKAPVKVGRRFGAEVDIIQLGWFYGRLSFLLKPLWVYPAYLLLVNFLVVHPACSSTGVRRLPILDDLCAGSFLNPKVQVPWYLDLWVPQGVPQNRSSVHSPYYMERIMVGHIRLHDSAVALRHQVLKTNSMAPGNTTYEMLGSLGKPNIVFERQHIMS